MPIVVDRRESAAGLPALLERAWQPVYVRWLTTGDVRVGRVLVERKEAHDFVQSLQSGRLFRQACRLRRESSRPLLILEGDPYPLVEREQRAGLRGAILSLLTGFGIPILKTADVPGTVESLVRIAVQEERRERKRRRRALERQGPGERRAEPAPVEACEKRTLEILERFPSIGRTRARALLQRFGSLERILSADPAELAKTPGVGPTTAMRLLTAFLRDARSSPEPS